MTKVLYIGDPHITVSELADGWALIKLINDTAFKHGVDAIVFLGDQYHHHGIVYLEVMHFWTTALQNLLDEPSGGPDGHTLPDIYLMVGNHDKPGNGSSKIHALMAHKDKNPRLRIVDVPMPLCPGVTMIPHLDGANDFLGICELLAEMQKKAEKPVANVIVCHQTFNGGQYDNGFYAKDGIDPEKVPQVRILSGHIHAPQEFGRVWYVGAPRWRTASDANTERNIWVVEHDAQGNIVKKTPVPTGGVCRRIYDLEMEESDTQRGLPFFQDQYDGKKDDVRITLKGGEEYLNTYRPKLEALSFKVRTVTTGTKAAPRIKESEGVNTAFRKFVSGYQPKNKTPADVLEKLVGMRLANAG